MIHDDQLRPFQREDVAKAVATRRFVFGHDTGLGKTVCMIAALERILATANFDLTTAKVLIIGSKNSMATWLRLLPLWTGVKPKRIHGQLPVRQKLWKEVYEADRGVWMVTYDTMKRDMAKAREVPSLQAVLLDEIHKARNRTTANWKVTQRFKDTPIVLGASATIVSRGAQDLWGILNILNPGLFTSYWRFVNTYCQVIESSYGKEIVGVKNVEGLKGLLKHYMVRRTWAEVLPEMPPITRELEYIELEGQQRQMYDTLTKEMMLELPSEGLIAMASPLAKLTRLRQIALCPRLLDPQAPLGSITEYLLEAVEETPHTVIFSMFATYLPILADALREKGYSTVIIKGGMEPEELNRAIAYFKTSKCVALCSIAFAESFDLSSVRAAYFCGWSWDPNQNIQAEGRLRRLDTQEFQGVNVKYLCAARTVDYAVKEVVEQKTVTANTIMAKATDLKKVLAGTLAVPV